MIAPLHPKTKYYEVHSMRHNAVVLITASLEEAQALVIDSKTPYLYITQTLEEYGPLVPAYFDSQEYLAVEVPDKFDDKNGRGGLVPNCNVIMRTKHVHEAIQWCRNLRQVEKRRMVVYRSLYGITLDVIT